MGSERLCCQHTGAGLPAVSWTSLPAVRRSIFALEAFPSVVAFGWVAEWSKAAVLKYNLANSVYYPEKLAKYLVFKGLWLSCRVWPYTVQKCKNRCLRVYVPLFRQLVYKLKPTV